jgi:preprotein translocase subunit YajC
MYVLVVLPQRRRQGAHRRMLDQMELGDEIITSGGIYGFVRGIGDEDLSLEVAEGTVVRVSKRAVAVVLERGAEGTRGSASAAEEDG